MKRILFLSILLSLFAVNNLHCQFLHAQWQLSSKKITDCEYDLIFTVMIDQGWHMPAVAKIKGAEKETFPTEIIFKTNKDYTLVGEVTESKPVSEYDKTIEKNVLFHYNKAVFTQRVKINSNSKLKIEGTYKHQICDKNKCDFPPKENFSFELKGGSACLK